MIQVYDKRDDFSFRICGNIASAPAYEVFLSQLNTHDFAKKKPAFFVMLYIL